jgi:hypothetical protein
MTASLLQVRVFAPTATLAGACSPNLSTSCAMMVRASVQPDEQPPPPRHEPLAVDMPFEVARNVFKEDDLLSPLLRKVKAKAV